MGGAYPVSLRKISSLTSALLNTCEFGNAFSQTNGRGGGLGTPQKLLFKLCTLRTDGKQSWFCCFKGLKLKVEVVSRCYSKNIKIVTTCVFLLHTYVFWLTTSVFLLHTNCVLLTQNCVLLTQNGNCHNWEKLGEIGRNILLTKIDGRNWEELGEIFCAPTFRFWHMGGFGRIWEDLGENWEELGGIGRNWDLAVLPISPNSSQFLPLFSQFLPIPPNFMIWEELGENGRELEEIGRNWERFFAHPQIDATS